VAFESTVSHKHATHEDEHFLSGNDIRYDEWGRIQFEYDVLPRERELNIQLGDWGACPGLASVLKEIYSSAIQIPGSAITAERNRLVISDNHPNFLFDRAERQGFGSYYGRAPRYTARGSHSPASSRRWAHRLPRDPPTVACR
jgi:hypothetical protein